MYEFDTKTGYFSNIDNKNKIKSSFKDMDLDIKSMNLTRIRSNKSSVITKEILDQCLTDANKHLKNLEIIYQVNFQFFPSYFRLIN